MANTLEIKVPDIGGHDNVPVIEVLVNVGDTVTKGQKLLTLEAMKMEHSLVAPFDGVVAELNAVAGGQVQVEALLVRIEAAE